jgi:transcriptional regulator with XRE-family HTH domain
MSKNVEFLSVAESLGSLVRHIRRVKGIEHRVLAAHAGMTKARLTAIERGEKEISFSELVDICWTFGVDVECKFEQAGINLFVCQKRIVFSGDNCPF